MKKVRSNDIGAILKRRAAFIIGTTVVSGILTTMLLTTLPKQYTAESKIMVLNADKQSLYTHKEALLSLAGVINTKKNNLTVTPARQASVLTLKLSDTNPKNTAELLNAITESYVEKTQTLSTSTSTSNNNGFLTKLKNNISEAKETLETFELKAAKNARAPSVKTHAAYEQAKISLQKSENDITPFLKKDGNFTLNPNAPALRNAPALQKLREKQRELVQKHTALSTRYGPKHPEMKALAASMTIVDQQIVEESEAILDTLKTNYALAKTRIKNLEEEGMRLSLEEEAKRYKQYNEKLNLLRSRVSEAEELLSTFRNSQINSGMSQNQAVSILKPASIPQTASFPNIPKLASLVACITGLLAALIALVQERRQNRFTSARQIEDTLNLQCYSLIPAASADKDKPIANYVLDNPSSPITEAVKTLKLNIKLHTEHSEEDCKVICLTSTLAGEGKTTLATWLARLAAKSGQRVILIDADIRRPSVHLALGQRNKNSLADHLSGLKKREEVIDTSDKSGLHVIYGRAAPTSAIDMISSEKMDTLIRNLRGTYDLIIIDTPASMAVPDARALEKRSDLFLYCIAWNKTSRTLIHNGISQFQKFSNPSIATVLTQIDPKKHVQLGYGMAQNEYEDYKDI